MLTWRAHKYTCYATTSCCEEKPCSAKAQAAPEMRTFDAAVLAQRKGEFLHLGMLERLAGLNSDLQAAVDSCEP